MTSKNIDILKDMAAELTLNEGKFLDLTNQVKNNLKILKEKYRVSSVFYPAEVRSYSLKVAGIPDLSSATVFHDSISYDLLEAEDKDKFQAIKLYLDYEREFRTFSQNISTLSNVIISNPSWNTRDFIQNLTDDIFEKNTSTKEHDTKLVDFYLNYKTLFTPITETYPKLKSLLFKINLLL